MKQRKEIRDGPSDEYVEQHGEEDDGHGGGDGDQDHLAALAGDGEGCWRARGDGWQVRVREFVCVYILHLFVTLIKWPNTLRQTSARRASCSKWLW